jgi:hypothetical protein
MRDYQATERGMYIAAFFRNIDSRIVERRLPGSRRSPSRQLSLGSHQVSSVVDSCPAERRLGRESC